MTYKPIPIKTQDRVERASTTDARLLEAVNELNTNVLIVIRYLAYMTDEDFSEDDIKDIPHDGN